MMENDYDVIDALQRRLDAEKELQLHVARIVGRYSESPDIPDSESLLNSLTRGILQLKHSRHLPKPSASSRKIAERLINALGHLQELLKEAKLASDLDSAMHWSFRDEVFDQENDKLCPVGIEVVDLGGFRDLQVSVDELPETWDGSPPYFEFLSSEDQDRFFEHVDAMVRREQRSFLRIIGLYERALASERVSAIGGKGAKRDIALDNFIYAVAANAFHYLPRKCHISDAPSSSFFQILDELLGLADIELSDRRLRERIEQVIIDTRADKWGKEGQ